ncbi:PREDICTED: uncharacterized protein LOC104819584 [Tarenaya hassleriana]|uniref:uncharacterized protein LOC104819584 n=1 Tax=Tarenaya hassleriana TaxID=28532 RepID=UPI00053C78F7|nr:PREDICTED: uncharacterized protein LOC104819584 [Tarenaya hassleriana]
MAYTDMQQQQHMYGTYAEPRISFSNDMAATKHEMNKYKEAPVSSEFEFGVKNYAMIPADQIFFQGVILPLKDKISQKKMATLREELSEDDDDAGSCSGRKTKGSSSWWRERLGLGFVRSKKDQKRASFHHHHHHQ